MNLRFLLTLATLLTLTYAIFSMKGYLNDNFIKNDTRMKESLNKILNGDY